MKKPTVHFQSRHESGNIYFLTGLVRNALQRQQRITDWNSLRDKIFSDSHSYDEALSHIREYVDLIDDDGVY